MGTVRASDLLCTSARALARIGLLVVSLVLAWGTDAAPAQRVIASRLARTLNGADTATLHLVRPGDRLLEEGVARGALPGHMRALLKIGPLCTGSFTIDTAHGQINGNGTATPHGTGRYQSFAGSLNITSGSGLYAHIHGHTTLYGVFDRWTYAVVVKTTGQLSYY
jgi:hypothetical protein